MKMNSKMIMISVVMLVIAALVVSPAAARDGSISDIEVGDVIFVYENNLNLSGLMGGTITQLRKYVDDDKNKALLKYIPVSNEFNFDVIGSIVDDDLGIYYLYDGTVDATKYIMISEPKAALDVVLDATHADSINSETIVKDTEFAFKITAPDIGSYYKYRNGTTWVSPQTGNIEVRTPSGGKVYKIGDMIGDLANVNIDDTQIYTTKVKVDSTMKAGTYNAVFKWNNVGTNNFGDYAANSNYVNFSVETKSICLDAPVVEIIHDTDFVVSLQGAPNTDYYMFIENANLETQEDYPVFMPSQVNVVRADTDSNVEAAIVAAVGSRYPAYGATLKADESAAKISTDVSGTITVGFDTVAKTDDRAFTIRAFAVGDSDKYDTVKITVLTGDVTIDAEGEGSYFLGSEIKVFGTNTDSNVVYLFMTGSNLDYQGVKLTEIEDKVVTDNVSTFDSVEVESDDTWEYNWDTAAIGLDTGSYTIYAASTPKDKNDIEDAKYGTYSVLLRKPFITATSDHSSIAKGDKLYIEGTAEGDPSQGIAIWVLGKNYYKRYTETVDAQSEYKKEISDTASLASGQYFIVVQHPMYNNVLDIVPFTNSSATYVKNEVTGEVEFIISGDGSLQGTDAATALIDAIDSSKIDDTYYKLSIMVEEPWIRINSIGTHVVNSDFTITGTTNLNSDNDLIITVSSASFGPTEKQVSAESSGTSGNAIVTQSENYNVWSFDVNTVDWSADEYIVTVESLVSSTMQSSTFELTSASPTPSATPVPISTPVPTPVPTQEIPTPVETVVPTPTPDQTSSPGFGALIALIGLGGVAVLVVRKE